ncbi:hypothetical protein C2845_PM13G05630 [Panicum miliaceum]|uniref:Uncharacterized protein n=1 Tax=Panicum miliaceum TaxID=4540 RepID=A0A3L6RIQ6_PANMI|nr:hypothetical protein C2845_PM13G05630 [Panicum miliaceum]
MPGPSPKRKERDESVDSSPRASKIMRHISPPPITRPGVQYESEDDKVFKGPKVVQLLRTIVKMHEEHKKLSDQVAELALDLKSARDDYDTLRRGRGVRIERLEKKVGKGNQWYRFSVGSNTSPNKNTSPKHTTRKREGPEGPPQGRPTPWVARPQVWPTWPHPPLFGRFALHTHIYVGFP